MVASVSQSFNGAWSVPDQRISKVPQPPINHNLQIPVSAVANGDWLIALIGWQQIGSIPTTVSVGDDAVNQWQPIATSPATEINAVLNANPNFASGLTGWGALGATATVATNTVYPGNAQSIKMVPLGGTNTRAYLQSTPVTVAAQQFYTGSMWVYSPAGYADAISFVTWQNSGTPITSILSTVTVVPPGAWTQIVVSGASPATANQALVGVQFNNSPQPGDIFYVGRGTLTPGAGFSANTRCAIWAAPNVRSSVTTVSVCPLGQVTAIAAEVLDVTGMPAWLQTNTSATGLAKASSALSVSVTPTANSFVVSAGALDNLTYTLNQLRAGWSSASYLKTVTNGVDTNGDVAVIGRTQTTNAAITASFYGVNPINSNPDFVLNTTGWQAVNGTLALSSLGFISAHSALLTPNGTSSSVTAQLAHATAPGVTVGLTYLGNTWIQATGSTASVKIGIEWLTGGLATISTTFSADSSIPADGSWYNLIIQATAPATAAVASLHVTIDGTPPVTRKLNIAEGAITTVTDANVDLAGAVAAFQMVPTSEPVQPNANWPDVRLEAAFGQPASTPPDQLVWTDISTRLLAWSTDRGRQYELNALQTGQVSLTLRNDDGYLTPGSSLDPGLAVYTPIRLTGLYSHRVYGIFQGFMERWPQTWVDAHFGIVPATGVDAWAMFTATLNTTVFQEVILDRPVCYWPCAAGSASSSAVNLGVSTNQTPLVVTKSPFGAGSSTSSFGDTSMQLNGDTNPNWACSGLTSTQGNNGYSLVYSGPSLPPLSGPGITIRFFSHIVFTGPQTVQTIYLFTMVGNNGPILALTMDSGGGFHILTWNANTGVMTDHGSIGFSIFNQTALFTIEVTATGFSYTLDGGIPGGSNLTGSDTLATSWSYFNLNGRNDSFAVGNFGNVSFSHIAIYNRPLNITRQITHWLSGNNGMLFDYGDYRVSRLISYLNWAPPQRIYADSQVASLSNGTAPMQMGGLIDIDGQVVGSAITNIAQTEQALLYVDRNGYLVYRIRQAATNQGIQAVLGENTATGELPYRVTLELDYDPQYINNDVQVTHVGIGQVQTSIFATGSVNISLKNVASINLFGDHSLQVNSYFANVIESINLANYLLSQYSTPIMRVAQVELIPGANPAQFATVLGLDIGDRITLNRRPIGAPPISLSVMIIGIHHDVEWKSGKWTTKLDLMPASIAVLATKALTLNDAVLGKLDSGNVVSW